MKIHPRCIPCEMEGAFEQVKLSTDDGKVQLQALLAFTKFLSSKISEDITPAKLGTERNKIIKKITNNSDPYRNLKRRMNEIVVKLEPLAKKFISGGKNRRKRLKRAVKVAVIGNSMDFSVSEHELDLHSFKEEFERTFRERLAYDDTEKIAERIESIDSVLYLLDNCGEVIADRIFMKEISDWVAEISVVARSKPVQDDVTVELAKKLNINKYGKILPAGEVTGVDPESSPPDVLERLETADLVISKGQGNLEMLSESEGAFKGRLVYLLKAKCSPISNFLGVERGSLISKFI